MEGKIIKGIAGFYYVNDGFGRVYACKAKGIFRNKKIKPLVGDDVEVSVLSEEEREGNIDQILPRRNALIRPAVSNVDQALVVFAVCRPAPNLNLLDRFLVEMERQGIPATLCFNKVDLCRAGEGGPDEGLRRAYEAAGYPILFISTYDGRGIDAVRGMLKGRTTVLAGPSGVGKSTLTNVLCPGAGMETGGLSQKIERGRHTTRHSELFFVEERTYLMDTPGFSSLFVDGMEADQLGGYFPEFAPYVDGCRFLGCAHMAEPVCGVKEAVGQGLIARSRYENYQLMYQELKQKKRY